MVNAEPHWLLLNKVTAQGARGRAGAAARLAGEAEAETGGGLVWSEGEGAAALVGVVVVCQLGAAAERASGGEDRDWKGTAREAERVRGKGGILTPMVQQGCLDGRGITPEAK